MDFKSPFIVYRISPEGKLDEVFHAEDLKKAKYWLTYIAQPGDVLCRTPAHPRHAEEKPKYWSHKESSGTPCSKEDAWTCFAHERNWDEQFPNEQHEEPAAEA